MIKDNRPKILFIMHMPPPVHGAAMVGKQIYESHLLRDTFDCSFVNYSTSSSLMEIGRFSLKKFVSVFGFLWQVYRKIKVEQPHLVYVTLSLSDLGFYRDCLMAYMLKRQKCQVIAHFHNKPSMQFMQKWYNKYLYKHFFRGLHTIFLADCLAEPFQKYTSREYVHICPNGIPDKVTGVSAPHNNGPYSFLFLSNMMEEKGVLVLLHACAILKKRECQFECKFVGQWRDVTENRFNTMCLELGISKNVYAYGGVYGDDKVEFFQQADAFIHPTLNDCFPLVLLEAMQYSLPIVSTYEGGIPNIVDERVGFLVNPHDSVALADAMQYLMLHPNVGRERGRQGRMKFEQEYILPIFEHRFQSILTQIVD